MKKYVYIGLPILGVLFYLSYLHIATVDVVYSDYIRLINSYLPDVWNPEKFFVADLLTRIPVNYLERIINVTFFGYSVTFDRVLSVLSFGASALILGGYCRKQRIGLGWYAAMMVFMFSLNKWEMLYNGTGWAHFLAFACFFYNYTVLDRVYKNHGKKGDVIRLAVLPAIITIGVAGPYCAIYSMTLIISYGFILVWNLYAGHVGGNSSPCKLTGKQLAILLASVIWPLLAYLWSNSQAVYVYSGAVEGSMIEAFFQEPKFFLKFLLKGFASMIFGVEFIGRHLGNVPGEIWCLLGLLVLAMYFVALWMNFYYGIYKKTIFPLMFLAGGGMNHLLVLVSRWIFMPNDLYGMSSRYALQYQIGVLGIMMTFALVYRKSGSVKAAADSRGTTGREGWAKKRTEVSAKPQENARCPWIRALAVAFAALVLAGNIATTVEEFRFGEMRKNSNLEKIEILLNYKNVDEETLQSTLEYRKPGTKEALQILEENGWNIFKDAN